jgi:hypothetical protein
MIKKLILSTIFVLFVFVSNAQDGPPAIAMPTGENEVLIDELIKVTDFERHFKDYCTKRVNDYAKQKNVDSKRVNQMLGSVSLKHFNVTLYNEFSSYSKDQLKRMIELFKKINEGNTHKLSIMSSLIQINLDYFVQSIIESEYE